MNTNECLAVKNCCQKTHCEGSRQSEERLLFELGYLESADRHGEEPTESDDVTEFTAVQPKSRERIGLVISGLGLCVMSII